LYVKLLGLIRLEELPEESRPFDAQFIYLYSRVDSFWKTGQHRLRQSRWSWLTTS
jgi:hypothetical protein